MTVPVLRSVSVLMSALSVLVPRLLSSHLCFSVPSVSCQHCCGGKFVSLSLSLRLCVLLQFLLYYDSLVCVVRASSFASLVSSCLISPSCASFLSTVPWLLRCVFQYFVYDATASGDWQSRRAVYSRFVSRALPGLNFLVSCFQFSVPSSGFSSAFKVLVCFCDVYSHKEFFQQ